MNRKEFDKTVRDPVSARDFDKVLRQVLTAPVGKSKSENREPTREELNQKWKLVGI